MFRPEMAFDQERVWAEEKWRVIPAIARIFAHQDHCLDHRAFVFVIIIMIVAMVVVAVVVE